MGFFLPDNNRERAARKARAAAVAALRRTYRDLRANEAAFQ